MNSDLHAQRRAREKLAAALGDVEIAQLVRPLAEAEVAYLFKHALIQDTAYGSLLSRDRTRLHHAVAEIIERENRYRLDEVAELLTHHFSQAGDDEKTSIYAFRAAEVVGRLNADREAVQYYQRALDALRRLPETDENRRRRVETIYGYIEMGWGASVPEEHFAIASEAETVARGLKNPDGTSGDARALARILSMRAALHLARNEYREASRYLREVLETSRELGDETILQIPTAQVGTVLVLQGHFAEAEPHLLKAKELVGERTDRWEWAWSRGFLGISLAMRGQLTRGMEEIHFLALERMTAESNQTGITQSFTYRLVVYLAQGALEELLETSRHSVEVAVKSGFLLYAAIGLGFQALAASRLGEHKGAQEALAAMNKIAAQLGGQVMMADWFAAAGAEIALNAGKIEEALDTTEQAVDMARARDGIFAEAWAQRVWGQSLAAVNPPRYEQAESHLALSLGLFEQGGARLEAARTRVVWGQVLSAQGNVIAAREHFERAAAQFETSGLACELEQTQILQQSL